MDAGVVLAEGGNRNFRSGGVRGSFRRGCGEEEERARHPERQRSQEKVRPPTLFSPRMGRMQNVARLSSFTRATNLQNYYPRHAAFVRLFSTLYRVAEDATDHPPPPPLH